MWFHVYRDVRRASLAFLRDEEILGFSRPIKRFLREKLGEPSTAGMPYTCKMPQLGVLEGSPAIAQARPHDTSDPSAMQTR